MLIKIFTLQFSARLQNFDTQPLDQFLSTRTAHYIEHHFFTYDQKPHLSVIVHYEIESALAAANTSWKSPTSSGRPSSGSNIREMLSDEEWVLFTADGHVAALLCPSYA